MLIYIYFNNCFLSIKKIKKVKTVKISKNLFTFYKISFKIGR